MLLVSNKKQRSNFRAKARFILIFFISWLSLQNTTFATGTKIGLTLSGGGAKGFAHIGVLHVIDSLGLTVDYITGTSMGSIVGGLYASGYSAAEIEDFALSVNWKEVFNTRPELAYTHISERRDIGRTLIEVPLASRNIKLGTGAIEGQQLWSLLEMLFFHVRTIDDFHQFKIPFACVATNIETGEPAVMHRGDIVTALRASMAIPAAFTSVSREDLELVDGGVVNNYPVDIVRKMGADYVVGVYVSDGLKPANELNTPVDIIVQMGFFKDAYMFRKNKEATDIFIVPDLSGYSTASFTEVKAIVERGKQIGRKFAHQLDSLNKSIPSGTKINKGREARNNSLVVNQFTFEGLEAVKPSFIRGILGVKHGDTLTNMDMIGLIERLYGTGLFDRVTYTYSLSADKQKANLQLLFKEKPSAKAVVGVLFNSFSGVGIVAGLSVNNLFISKLHGQLRVMASQHPSFIANLQYFTGVNRKKWIGLHLYGDLFEFPLQLEFVKTTTYQQRYGRMELNLNWQAGNDAIISAGFGGYSLRFKPLVGTDIRLKGENQSLLVFGRYNRYSLDRHAFPRRGTDLLIETNFFFSQSPSFEILGIQDQSNPLLDFDISNQNLLQFKINWRSYQPVNSRLSYFSHVQAGYNVDHKQGFFNNLNVGGTDPILRDQILFAGLEEYALLTPTIATYSTGLQYNVWSSFYLIPLINAGIYDFRLDELNKATHENLLYGGALQFGYQGLFGPVKATVSYSHQTGRVITYASLGWQF